MMNEDEQFKALMRDYAADTPDGGFSDDLLRQLEHRNVKRAKLRRYGLLSAWFVGGIIAGLQVKAVTRFAPDFTVPSLFSDPKILVGAAAVCAVGLFFVAAESEGAGAL